jgi:heme/copper-type cytochrome/quinol oxidase subunit 4
MRRQRINRVSGKTLIVLSLIALLTVLSGYFQEPQADEGAAAHIFQLSVVALVPAILLFLATADWAKPSRNTRLLTFAGVTMALAFGALYYLEHYFYVGHFR